jgi:hypothetical protein
MNAKINLLVTQLGSAFVASLKMVAILFQKLAVRFSARPCVAPKASKEATILKARPATLEQRYRILHDSEVVDEVFFRLRRHLYGAVDHHDERRRSQLKVAPPRSLGATTAAMPLKAVFRETGRLAPDRSYFYLKPAGETGLLFERSGAGWVISKAEKIIGQNLFLREGDALDQVSLYFATDRPATPRVMSRRLGGDLLPLAVYEQKLRQNLGLDAAS